MLIFALVVAIASLLIAVNGLKGVLRWSSIAGVLVLGATIWILLAGSGAVARGATDGAWFRRSPASEVLLFVAMVIGMSSRYLWDLIELRKRSNAKGTSGGPIALGFDWLEFLQPLLISALVFEVILANSREFSGSTLLFSFQNGFFWQSVIKPKLISSEG